MNHLLTLYLLVILKVFIGLSSLHCQLIEPLTLHQMKYNIKNSGTFKKCEIVWSSVALSLEEVSSSSSHLFARMSPKSVE